MVFEADNGRLLDPALLPRIFTFFRQDDDSRRRGAGLPGAGLLPVSKSPCRVARRPHLAESRGLRRSPPSPDTTLRTVAEAAAVQRPLAVAGDDPGHRRSPSSRRRGRRGPRRHVVAEFVELHGDLVKIAATVRAALDLYVRGDVLVSEHLLPDGTGYDVVRGVSSTGQSRRWRSAASALRSGLGAAAGSGALRGTSSSAVRPSGCRTPRFRAAAPPGSA
jgi:hypothetical protein